MKARGRSPLADSDRGAWPGRQLAVLGLLSARVAPLAGRARL